MKRTRRFVGAIFGGVLAAALAPGGQAVADSETQIWTRAGVHYRFAERWRADFEQRLRLTADPLQVSAVIPELALNYDVTKWLRLAGGYRYIKDRNRFDRFVTWHRFFADAEVETKWNRLRIENRVRYQEQITSDFNRQNRHRLRNRLLFGWDTDAFVEPYGGGEIHYNFGGADGSGWHKYRLEAGLRFKFGPHRMATAYRFENQIADTNDPHLHVVLLQYHYNL